VLATALAAFDRLVAITAQSESGGNPNAVSRKGARGLMQVMPATSGDPGFGVRSSNGSAADDVRLGQDYLAAMHTRYGGDLAKTWSSYNAGPGRIDKLVSQHGENWLHYAPAETRAYVARNLRAMRGR
jgi:soluble lytic murein transglycosylase-like protein